MFYFRVCGALFRCAFSWCWDVQRFHFDISFAQISSIRSWLSLARASPVPNTSQRLPLWHAKLVSNKAETTKRKCNTARTVIQQRAVKISCPCPKQHRFSRKNFTTKIVVYVFTHSRVDVCAAEICTWKIWPFRSAAFYDATLEKCVCLIVTMLAVVHLPYFLRVIFLWLLIVSWLLALLLSALHPLLRSTPDTHSLHLAVPLLHAPRFSPCTICEQKELCVRMILARFLSA